MVSRLYRYLRRWALRRQGIDDGIVELASRRVYILPTRTGVIFGIVLATMLLGALNYSNNMGFALAFLLASLAVVSIHHCQRNLVGLRLAIGGCGPVFAGEAIECRLLISNPGGRQRVQVIAGPEHDGTPAVDVGPGGSASLALLLPTVRRGHFPCPPVRVSTTYPLGLFRAWAWLYPGVELLVYPAPAPPGNQPPSRPAGGPEDGAGTARGSEEFVGLTALAPGESPSRIAWKALARSGDLLAKDYRGGSSVAWLDWDAVPERDPERRLSVLARMVLTAEAAGQSFGLRLPGVEIEPAAGREQMARCLRALAILEPAPRDIATSAPAAA